MDKKLDEMDRKILMAVQQDAALSVDALADKVGLSRNACWRRMKALEAAGIIRKRVALLDAEAIGLSLTAYVMVRTNRHDEEWLETFHRAVRALPEIVGAHRMSGDLDYILRVRLTSMRDYDAFYQRLIRKVPLSDISASFVMEDIKDTTALPL
ncbi:MAG: Lrp/AsnC family transcriptional regulator [Pseudomonadota bacterium]